MRKTQGEVPSAVDSRQQALARLRVGAAVVFALPLIGLLTAIVLLYRQAFEEAEQTVRGATRVAQEHALKVFDTNDMLLARMLDLLGDKSDAYWLAHSKELHDGLAAMSTGLLQVQGLFINGADGRMLGSDRVFPPVRNIDYSDREYFIAHRSGNGPPVFFTEQLVSRSTGERFFDMSRRRLLPGGRFGGTVNVSLRPEYFDRFWQELAESSPGLRVALVRTDGRLIARWPGAIRPGDAVPDGHPLVERMKAAKAEGEYEAESPLDPQRRIVSFRRLADRPVYVVAALNRSEVIASWAKTAGLLALFVVPLTLALGWLVWLALRRTRQEIAMAERLESEAAARQRAELALAHSQKLETAGRLAAGVAHEINNLLMIVSNHVQLLQVQSPMPAGFAPIDRAIASGKRLTRQLLALSGRQAMVPELVRLQDRLPGFLSVVRAALPRTVEVKVDVASDTHPIVVDAEELELALLNLVLNARDAMPQGGNISISCRNDAAAVVVEVADNGSGIDPAILQLVREPLFTTKPRGKGSGLGLTQVQALCSGAGASLNITSQIGQGTRVEMVFPAARKVDLAVKESSSR